MYIPKHFEQEEQQEAFAFIRQFPFGTLVTNGSPSPTATHLPFILEEVGDKAVLWSHLAKANPQGQQLAQQRPLVVFTEPHAYISPKHYTRKSVPTWNYIAVHVYGRITIIEEEEALIDLMKKSIATFDPEQRKKWAEYPTDYIQKLLRGITAFRIDIEEVQAKEKLSQNRNATEKRQIIDALQQSTTPTTKMLGDKMQQKLKDGDLE